MSIYKWYVDVKCFVSVVLTWAHYVNIEILFCYRIFNISYGNMSMVYQYRNDMLTFNFYFT